MTSRWVTEVSEVRGFEVAWHPISLHIINEGREPGPHAEGHRQGLRMGRVVVAAEQLVGTEAVGPLYTALGTRIHPGGRDDVDGIIAESVAEVLLSVHGEDRGQAQGAADLSARLMAAAEDTEHDSVLRAKTEHALKIAGPDVGVPIISIDGVAFFGPVVTPAPTGDLALQLWDGIRAAASVPGFFELKRGRQVGPQF